jgi:hypothetical protein
MKQRVEALEPALERLLGESSSQQLCALLKAISPKIYKDQLVEAKQINTTHIIHYGDISAALLERILIAPRLTATQSHGTPGCISITLG